MNQAVLQLDKAIKQLCLYSCEWLFMTDSWSKGSLEHGPSQLVLYSTSWEGSVV